MKIDAIKDKFIKKNGTPLPPAFRYSNGYGMP